MRTNVETPRTSAERACIPRLRERPARTGIARHEGDCSDDKRAEFQGGVEPHRDIVIDLGGGFRLEGGESLQDPRLTVRVQGPEDAPLLVVAGGISAGRKIADAADASGWWRTIVGAGAAIDLARFRVLGFDFLPGEERAVRTITADDQARALAIALDAINGSSVYGFLGASYGGVAGLAFAARHPKRLAKLCVISAAARPDPMATALRGVQRRIIAMATASGRPAEGVALARELAMTTYRGAEEFAERFSSHPEGPRAGEAYDVCAYLQSRGRAYAERMGAARYVSLSDSLDRSRVDPTAIAAECLFIAVEGDRLVPARDVAATAAAVSGPAACFAFASRYGHDAFLCDTERFAGRLKRFFEGGTHVA